MTEIGWATLGVIPSFKGFESKLDQGTGKAMLAAGANGGAKFGDAAGRAAGGKFKSHMKSAAKIGALGLAAAGAAAFKFGGDALEEAREAQKVGKLTDAVIKSTGKSARVSARHVGALSGRLSDMAGVDDELIQSGANVLLTFTKIRNEAGEGNKVFDRAALSALNMSAALGTDLKGSSIQLGKALNDPIKGVSALGRAGVQFSEDQKKAIKGMVDSGNTLGAQKVILRELDTQFKGSARSQATEADKLGVAYGNLKEDVGTALLPVMDDLAVFLRKKGIPALREAGDWVTDEGIPAMKDFADEIKPVVGHAKDLAGWLNDLPKPAKLAGLTALFGGIGATKLRGGGLGGGGALGTAGKVLGISKPVPVFVTNMGFGAGGVGGKGLGPKDLSLGGAAGLAATVATAAGVLLYKFGPRPMAPGTKPGTGGVKAPSITGWAVGEIEDFFTKTPKYDKSLGVLNNSWSKVRDATDSTRESTKLYDGTIRKVPTLWKTVFEVPGLDRNLTHVNRYRSMLDGLDGRTVTTILETRYTNTKPGDVGDGRGTGQPPNRSGNTFIHNGDVVAPSPRDYVDFNRKRARNVNGGGVDW